MEAASVTQMEARDTRDDFATGSWRARRELKFYQRYLNTYKNVRNTQDHIFEAYLQEKYSTEISFDVNYVNLLFSWNGGTEVKEF